MDFMVLLERVRERLDELAVDWKETPLGDDFQEMSDNLDAVITELRS